MEATQKSSAKTGQRAAFPEDVINEDLVREYEASEVRHARCEIRNRLKWVRQHLNREMNLPLSAWYLLDELIGMTHDVDWAGGPITVWPSNELMMTWLDISERQLQVLLTKLRKAHMICYIDSPTRQRWGRRDPSTGRILEAYGIDLRPLAQRVPKLIELAEAAQRDRHDAIQRRRQAKAMLARIGEYIRTARKELDERPGAANDNWDSFTQELARASALIEPKRVTLGVLDKALELLRPLEARVRKAIARLFRPKAPLDQPAIRGSQKESSPTGESQFTHKTTTKPLSSNEETVGLSGTRVGGSDRAQSSNEHASGDGRADNRASTHRSERSNRVQDNARWAADHLRDYKITELALLTACPSVREMGDPALDPADWTWSDIKRAVLESLSIMGVGAHAWKSLRAELGDHGACVAGAIITEKFTQGARGHAPAVANPGGYAYWIARRAKDERFLDLGPKVHALLKSPRCAE
jgi:replication initiation protein RepC